MSNKVNKNDVVDFLLGDDNKEKRMILLFDNSKELREANNEISGDLRDSVNFTFDKSTAFNVTNSMIRHAKKKVFLGLNKDIELLEGEYSQEEIKTYGEEGK